jgi:hypothetical protein
MLEKRFLNYSYAHVLRKKKLYMGFILNGKNAQGTNGKPF